LPIKRKGKKRKGKKGRKKERERKEKKMLDWYLHKPLIKKLRRSKDFTINIQAIYFSDLRNSNYSVFLYLYPFR
jgi:hypothetical protein